MIAFVKGILDSVSEDKIIVENQNIGFEILVPGSVVSELPQVGNTVKIYTYTYVREDALQGIAGAYRNFNSKPFFDERQYGHV